MDAIQVFDHKKLMSSTCDDEELAREVVSVVLMEMPVHLEQLSQAVVDGDAKVAERMSHSIKGVAATAGGERLRETALVCEQFGHEGNLAELAKLLPTMRSQYEEFEKALRASGLI